MTGAANVATTDVLRTVRADGFAAGPTVPAVLLDRLRSRFDELGVDPHQGYFTSGRCRHRPAQDGDITAAEVERADADLRSMLHDFIRAAVPGHTPIIAGFISKGAHSGAMEFHQDLTHTRESSVRSFLLWIPLVDVTEQNGALRFVPASHAWTSAIRPCCDEAPATAGLQDEFDALAVTLERPAGSSVVWDSAVVHGSLANQSGVARPAVAIVVRPDDAELLHVHLDDSRVPTAELIDDSYFVGGVAHPGTTVRVWSATLASSDLRAAMARVTEADQPCRRPWWNRLRRGSNRVPTNH